MVDRIAFIVMIVLMLGLSALVVRSKNTTGAMRAALASSTHEFVNGRDVPAVPVQTGETPTTLRAFCEKGRRTAYFVTTRACPYCAEIEPDWVRLASEGKHQSFVQVHLDGLPEKRAVDPGDVIHVSASPSEVQRLLHISTVPAVISSDSSCMILSAGAGKMRAELVLDQFASAR